jgi:hypothetical protein
MSLSRRRPEMWLAMPYDTAADQPVPWAKFPFTGKCYPQSQSLRDTLFDLSPNLGNYIASIMSLSSACSPRLHQTGNPHAHAVTSPRRRVDSRDQA